MTEIKIRDAEWFDKHCCKNSPDAGLGRSIRPKGAQWKKFGKASDMVYWIRDGEMHKLAGKELEVEFTDKREAASKISSARYVAGGYWIPNWAIEWVKEG